MIGIEREDLPKTGCAYENEVCTDKRRESTEDEESREVRSEGSSKTQREEEDGA